MVTATVARLTTRALFGRRRVFILLPLPILLIGLATLLHQVGVDPDEWAGGLIIGLGLAVLLPVTALVIGTGVLGSEIEDGTIVHLLTKPLARYQIVLAKLAVAAAVTTVTAAVPLYVTGVLAGGHRLGLGLAVGAALGATVYSALFLLLSLLTRRPVLLGLVYVLIWEGLLNTYVPGTRVLAVQQYVGTVTDRIAPVEWLPGSVSLPVALSMAAVLTVAATVLAVNRLRAFDVAGDVS